LNIFLFTYYSDPVNGNNSNDGSINSPFGSFQSIIDDGLIHTFGNSPIPYDASLNQPVTKNSSGLINTGDTILLLDGLHGNIFIRNYVNDEYIFVIAAEGATPVLEKLQIQAGEKWHFEGIHISPEPYGQFHGNHLAFFESHNWHGPASHITMKNCEIYTVLEPWITADEWLVNVSNGIYMRGDSMIAVGNQLSNVDMGITALGDGITANYNQIVNFSGDGMRVLGSDIMFHGNVIKNCYDVDDNHDDGIQSFVFEGNTLDRVTLSANVIINYEDENQPLKGSLQGIGCFDGFYHDWLIVNNVIAVDHWHGITLLGAINCHIINNTVLDPTPDVTPGPSWIRIDEHKDGTPSSDCFVHNNVANNFVAQASLSNNQEFYTVSEYMEHFVDPVNHDYHLLETSNLIDAGTTELAPFDDIEGVNRQAFGPPDIGAHEYVVPLSSQEEEFKNFSIFPNPFRSHINVNEILNDAAVVRIYSNSGKLIHQSSYLAMKTKNFSELPIAYYFLEIWEHDKLVHKQWILKL